MKKLLSFAVIGATSALLAACADRPQCLNQNMDKCGFGTVYSEERSATAEKTSINKKTEPAPVVAAPAPTPAPAPAPVAAPEPEPVPAPADTEIMTEAPEPSLDK